MAGGFWGKGNNPFFNYDSDAAQRDRETHRERELAHKEKLEHELDLQKQQSRADAERSKLRIQKNAMQAGYEEQIKEYEARIQEMRKAFYCLVLRSCVFEKHLNDFMIKHPEMGEEILDELQVARDYCYTPEYRQKWWDWVKKVDINYDMDYLNFPYEKRESKK